MLWPLQQVCAVLSCFLCYVDWSYNVLIKNCTAHVIGLVDGMDMGNNTKVISVKKILNFHLVVIRYVSSSYLYINRLQ